MALPELDKAPDEIKLAVDLIYLLETNEVSPKVALKALEVVKADLEEKIRQENGASAR